MGKRHDNLVPLTHDHHHALVQVRKLRAAAKGSDEERSAQAREFVSFFEKDTVEHFREEEESIFPLVVDRAEAEPHLERIMMEHLRIHASVHSLRSQLDDGDASTTTMEALASMLEQHIRYEEKTLFPLVELLASSELEAVELAPRNRG